MKVTRHEHRAELTTRHPPAAVFAVAADLGRFVDWYYDPAVAADRVTDPERRVQPVDGGGLAASVGVRFAVASTEGSVTVPVRGTITTREAGRRTFVVDAVEEDRRLALRPERVPEGAKAVGPTLLELTLEPDAGGGSRVLLVQHLQVNGRGLGPRLARVAQMAGPSSTQESLERLLALVTDG